MTALAVPWFEEGDPRELMRWAIALWTVYLAQADFCEAYMVLSYKFPQLKARWLFGYCAEAEERLIPWFRATTTWEIAICLLSSMLFLFATVALLRRARCTPGLFAMAVRTRPAGSDASVVFRRPDLRPTSLHR